MRSTLTTPGGIEVTRDRPDDEDGDPAPRVVFVHGAMDRASSFGRAARHLRDLHLDRYDRRGYGRSIDVGTGTVEQHVGDLIDVLDGRPATVVGHSLGGLVAVMAAARRPDLVRSVVAYEPPAPWAPWWGPGKGGGLQDLEPGDAAETFLRRMLGARTWERFPPALRAERRREGPALQSDLAIGEQAPTGFRPADVVVPVLVGCGSRASERHRRGAEAMADDVGDGRLVVLEGADHGAHLGQPSRFADLVRRGQLLSGGAS